MRPRLLSSFRKTKRSYHRVLLLLVVLALVATSALGDTRRRAVHRPSKQPLRTDYAVEVIRDVTYASVEGFDLKLNIVRPIGPTGKVPAILFLPKLILSEDSREYGIPRLEIFAQRGYFGISADVRRNAQFPAQIEDIKAAIRFLRANATAYGIDTSKIAAFGYYEGGYLVALAAASGNADQWNNSGGSQGFASNIQAVAPVGTYWDWFTFPSGCEGWATDAITRIMGCRPSQCPDLAREASIGTYATEETPPFFNIGSGNNYVAPGSNRRCDIEGSKNLHHQLISRGIESMFWEGPDCGGDSGNCLNNEKNLDRVRSFFDEVLGVTRAPDE
ncbi:MAG TPA: alpha/beta hydrolase [Thermoanaerobaculia bacterium]|nr:alpha/beta hydrolase [Thermoanaerobaculia bacterium]